MFAYDSRQALTDLECMSPPSVYTRTLQAAAQMVGGERALARYLRVPLSDVFVWMRPGAEPPPMKVFLRAVDLLLHDLEPNEQRRAQELRVAAHHKAWSKVA